MSALPISHFIGSMTIPDQVYLKKKKEIVCAEEVDLYPLDLYKDYVPLPYFDEENELYDAFLDYYQTYLQRYKVKEQLHASDNFPNAFNRLLETSWEYGLDCYWKFVQQYIRPYAITWLQKNKIPYEDDLQPNR